MARRNKKVSQSEIDIAIEEEKNLAKNEVTFPFPEATTYLNKKEIIDFARFCKKINRLLAENGIKRAPQ